MHILTFRSTIAALMLSGLTVASLAVSPRAAAQATGPIAERWEARGDRVDERLADRTGQRRQGRRG